MQKSLKILTSVKESQISEEQKKIAILQNQIEANKQSIKIIKEAIAREVAFGRKKSQKTSQKTLQKTEQRVDQNLFVNIQSYLGNFIKNQEGKIKNFTQIINKQQESLAEIQKNIQEIFLEKKRYEILANKIKQEEKMQTNKKEQIILDEKNTLPAKD